MFSGVVVLRGPLGGSFAGNLEVLANGRARRPGCLVWWEIVLGLEEEGDAGWMDTAGAGLLVGLCCVFSGESTHEMGLGCVRVDRLVKLAVHAMADAC